ncbi:Uma2 family endonuclease [Sphingomonas glacialis]|uniref:Uma2 family endonuclease n=1 Tax=Sphingomonas glacialis TaxID=658225 RepID=A0A502G0E4_9SPHN|nr:Uma2 family endonuclease [Sphingomonas glacialis]TPG54776.1 Uma2 family endonuclease [Sphingomonas glacialis]
MNVLAKLTPEQLIEPRKLPLCVEDFIVLQESGALDAFAKSELIDGDIYTVNAIHRPHAAILADINADLVYAVRASGLALKVYTPVSTKLDEHNLPEPDLVIATIEREEFVSGRSVRLAVEVSASSLAFDLGKKAQLYARSDIPEYWVVDVTGRRIVQMTAPIDGAYSVISEIRFGDRITAITIPQIAIDTTALA